MAPTQGIRHLVHGPGAVLENKSSLLKIHYPLTMHPAYVLLRVKKLQSVVIAMKNELTVKKKVLPLLEGPDDGIKYLLIGGPLLSCFAKLLAKELNWATFLNQDGANAGHASIGFYFKWLGEIR